MRSQQFLVAGLGDADMIWLLSQGHLRKLRAGERLVEAGRPLTHLFFVVRGSLDVVRSDGSGVATLCESDVIGEMSFVEQRTPSVSVRANADPKGERVEVLQIARDAILARFEQEPLFAARFYRALAMFLSARLRETTAARPAPVEPGPGAAETEERFRGLWRRLTG